MQSLDKDILDDKQHGEDVKRGVELLPVGAQHVDGNIRDNATEDTVGDAVCKRHHDDGDESRDSFGIVVEVDVLYRRQHEQANDYQYGSCGSSRNREEQRSEEQSHGKANSCREGCKTCTTALGYTRSTLDVGCCGTCAQACASHSGDGVCHESLVKTRNTAVLAHHTCLGTHTNEGTHSVEHIDKEEGEHHDDHIDGKDVVKLELTEDRLY